MQDTYNTFGRVMFCVILIRDHVWRSDWYMFFLEAIFLMVVLYVVFFGRWAPFLLCYLSVAVFLFCSWLFLAFPESVALFFLPRLFLVFPESAALFFFATVASSVS